MKRVLVTGSDGYLGSHVVQALKLKGCEVIEIDAGWFSFPEQSCGRTLVSDLSINDIVGCDAVIHLAWFSSAGQEFQELQEYSLHQTEHLAKLCEEAGCYLIFASTASVYGFQEGGELTEECEPNPVCAYGKAKLKAERLISDIITHDRWTFLRKGTLMGAGFSSGDISYNKRTRLDLVVNAFVASASTEGIIEVWDPETYRPQLHVADAADVYARLAIQPRLGIFNLAHKNYMILPLAHWVKNCLCDWDIDIEVSFNVGDGSTRSYCISCEKADKFGFPRQRGVSFAVKELSQGSVDFKGEANKNVAWMKKLELTNGWLKTIKLPEIW